jgi:hypothetical protein
VLNKSIKRKALAVQLIQYEPQQIESSSALVSQPARSSERNAGNLFMSIRIQPKMKKDIVTEDLLVILTAVCKQDNPILFVF